MKMIANMSYISSDSLGSIRFIYDSLASLALGMLYAFTARMQPICFIRCPRR